MLISRPAPEFNSAPAAGATITLKVPISEPKRLHALTLRAKGFSNTNQVLIASSVVREVRLLADSDLKCRWKPSLLRKFEDFFNSNSDTLPVNEIMVPFSRHLDPDRGWGTSNIGEMLLEVDCITPLPANTAFSALKAYQHYIPLDAPVPRGDVYLASVFAQPVPVAGWNTIQNLPYQQILALTHLLFDNPAITEVKISLGSRELYHATKEDVLAWMEWNPVYKVPSTCTATAIDGQAVVSTGPFFVPLDVFGRMAESMPVFAGGVRQDVTIEYFWDTNVNAVAAFDIMAQALERDTKIVQPVAAGKA
jgi:hypothetical protein